MIVRESRDTRKRETDRVQAARRRAAGALSWTDVIDRRRSSFATDDAPLLATAEVAECDCPDFCERDHDND